MTHTPSDGYLATPPEGAAPGGGECDGVLVLHAWWGLNDTIRAFCDRLAEAGFTAFAPDLYHGKVVDTIPDAEAAVAALEGAGGDRVATEVAEAARFLAERVAAGERAGAPGCGLAVIGFSLGAYYALDLSARHPDLIRSVVLFYGSGPADFSRSQAAYQGHFAENDPYEPAENVAWLKSALEQAGRRVAFYHYPGTGHWFFEPDRADAYNAEAASLAWGRTLAFLNGSVL